LWEQHDIVSPESASSGVKGAPANSPTSAQPKALRHHPAMCLARTTGI